MKLTRYSIYSLLILLGIACSGPDTNYRVPSSGDATEDNNNSNGNTSNELIIEQQFRSFYDDFIAEMQTRDVDLSDIPISIQFINPDFQPGDVTYCGLGYFDYDGNGNARVEIVNSGDCWSSLAQIEKENLMFHEFGHALLARFHLTGEGFFPNGSSKSIMCSGNGCSNFSVYTTYQDEQRDFYIDELIDEDIAMPSWAGNKSYSSTLVEDAFSPMADGWLSGTEALSSPTNPYSYFIDDNEFYSASNSLAISVQANTESNTFGNWYKDFELSDFESCSNIIAIANFKLTAGITNGFVNLNIDLFDDVNSETEFIRYSAESEITDVGNGYYRLSSTAICVPEEAVKFRIRLALKSESAVNVYFDDLKVDLYD